MLFKRKIIFIIFWSIMVSDTNTLTFKKLPIVFHKNYDISFWGIEKLHPFDTKKYGKIASHLQRTFSITCDNFYKPEKITDAELLTIHSESYLATLKSSSTIAKIAEVPILSYIPNFLLQSYLLDSMRYAVSGSILAVQLAMKYGWAINLSGGYHHAKANNGEGFCFFADIPIAVKKLREMNPNLKILIVDLDAHQGNGIESILGADPLTYIFDMYSKNNYPRDVELFKYIDFNFPLDDYIKDQEYLGILESELPKAIEEVKPDLIIYNAGTDIFEKDPLGKMKISKDGILKRDAFVFKMALENKIPIAMVLSGGYSKESADIVGCSIENILKQFDLLHLHINYQDFINRTRLIKKPKK